VIDPVNNTESLALVSTPEPGSLAAMLLAGAFLRRSPRRR
jgi:hypothetical protein